MRGASGGIFPSRGGTYGVGQAGRFCRPRRARVASHLMAEPCESRGPRARLSGRGVGATVGRSTALGARQGLPEWAVGRVVGRGLLDRVWALYGRIGTHRDALGGGLGGWGRAWRAPRSEDGGFWRGGGARGAGPFPMEGICAGGWRFQRRRGLKAHGCVVHGKRQQAPQGEPGRLRPGGGPLPTGPREGDAHPGGTGRPFSSALRVTGIRSPDIGAVWEGGRCEWGARQLSALAPRIASVAVEGARYRCLPGGVQNRDGHPQGCPPLAH